MKERHGLRILPVDVENRDVETARHELIKQAARLGGNAILFDTSSITRAGGDQSSSPVLTGKVIVYTDSTGSN